LIGPVLLYRERESISPTLWKRREVPRCEEFSLRIPPPQALLEYDDTDWDNCLVKPRWDSQIHGRWRAKHFLWCRTKVKVPAEWDGKEIWLEVGRAQDTTWVYVDGKLAGKVTMLLWRGDPCNALSFLDQRDLHFLDGLPSPPWQPVVYPEI
jgi:hypothetical protein